MRTCQEIVERCTDYLEGDLTRLDRWELWMHLAICRACARYLGQLRLVASALHGLEAEAQVRPEHRDALRVHFETWRAGRV